MAAGKATEQQLLPFVSEHDRGMLANLADLGLLAKLREKTLQSLEGLKFSLNASTIVLLLESPGVGDFSIYAAVSERRILNQGDFAAGFGVLGSLKSCSELSLAPYRPGHPPIPYHVQQVCPGYFFAQRFDWHQSGSEESQRAILCLERDGTTPLDAAAKGLIRLHMEQIDYQVGLCRELIAAEFERQSLFQAFSGLHLLTPAYDLQSVFAAAGKAVRLIVDVEQLAFSFVEEDCHRFQYLDGPLGKELAQESYPLEDSLIGQAVKYRRVVPEQLGNPGHFRVVNGTKCFDQFHSLMVLPLVLDAKKVLGVMLLAARTAGAFNRHQRDLIGLIVSQLAIKVDLALANEQINRMSLTDALTGIANRRAFERGFDAIYERALRREGQFSLIICDIDYFKQINDVYGHSCGDMVLKQVSRQLQTVVRSGDLAARVGGEEFVVLLEDSSESGARDVAERLRRQVESLPLYWQGEVLQVTMSFGVACYPKASREPQKLYELADKALYRAKQSGRNRSLLWRE